MNNQSPMDLDRFSWTRVWNFGKIYSHSLRRQIIAYGIFSLISAVCALLPLGGVAQMGLYSMFGSALYFAYYLSPLVLSKWGDTRMVMDMAPALPIEKFTFFMLYFLVVLPILLFAPTTLCQLLYMHIPAIQTEALMNILHVSFDYGYNNASKFLQGYAILLCCFYVVLCCKGNRTLKGVLTVFGIMIGIGLIGFIFGFTVALTAEFDANQLPVGSPEFAAMDMNMLIPELKIHLVVISVISAIAIVSLLWLIFRRLSHPKIS